MIPKYKSERVDAGVVTEKYSGAVDQAKAQGQAGVAQAQKGMAAQHGQRARQEVSSLAQRLSSFSRGLDQLAGQTAQKMGAEKASEDIIKKNNKIRQIESDPSIDPETKAKMIGDERLALQEDYHSVYGSAYNNEVEANYSNDILLIASKRAADAASASGGDPEKFKESFRKYSDEVLRSAPSEASKLVGMRAFDRAGMQTYKSLYSAKKSAFDKEAKDTFDNAVKNMETSYTNMAATSAPDMRAMDESKALYANILSGGVKSGHISRADADQKLYELDITAETEGLSRTFKNEFDAGNGVAALEAIKKMNESGSFKHFPVGEADKRIKLMQSAVEERGKVVLNDVMDSFNAGKIPPVQNIEEAKKYLPYMSEQQEKDYVTAYGGAEMYFSMKDIPINEQLAEIENVMSSNVLDATSIEQLSFVKGIVEKKVAKAKKDPIALARDEGLYSVTALSIDNISHENLSERWIQSNVAKQQYGTEQKFFTEDEVEQFSAFINDPGTSSDQKVALAAAVDKATNGKGSVAFRQFTKKGYPVFAGVAELVHAKKFGTAKKVMMGEQYLKEGTLTTDRQELNYQIEKEIGNAFMLNGAGDAARAKKTVEAMAAYIAMDTQKMADGKIEDSAIKEAITAVVGEIGEVNDQKFAVPYGVKADDVVEFFEDIDEMENLRPIDGIAENETGYALSKARPVYIGDGKYGFYLGGIILKDTDGKKYTVEYTK